MFRPKCILGGALQTGALVSSAAVFSVLRYSLDIETNSTSQQRRDSLFTEWAAVGLGKTTLATNLESPVEVGGSRQ